jgi:hypothetical protein
LQFQKLIISYPGHGDLKMINQILIMPKGIERYGRVLDKVEKMRKLIRLQGAINEIIPEADGIPLIRMAYCYTPKLSVKPEDVSPPKETILLPYGEQYLNSTSAK